MNQEVFIKKLRCNDQHHPIGIDKQQPRLSWQLASNRRNTRQTSYRIVVADSEAQIEQNVGNVWDSGRVTSENSIHIPVKGELKARQRYFWRSLVWDEKDKRTDWSPIAFWEMGLLGNEDWSAQWIGSHLPRHQPTYFQHRFELWPFSKARLYATAVGCYKLWLNGRCLSDAHLTPSWSNPNHFLYYQTYDVTEWLHTGQNAIGVIVAEGWQRTLPDLPNESVPTGLLLQLEATDEDGRIQTITTNESWRCTDGPLQTSHLINGEEIDARQEIHHFATAACDLNEWTAVRVEKDLQFNLVAQVGTAVYPKSELAAVAIQKAPDGSTIVDFGQNFSGWVRLQVEEEAGTAVTLQHAELLTAEGNIYTDNLRTAEQRVSYRCSGEGVEWIEPCFTIFGFRYVKISGHSGELTSEQITAVVAYSDLNAAGHFICSNDQLNQLHQNIVWSQRSNSVDVPTDCPQRDERLGWSGDTHLFSKTAVFNMNMHLFYRRWLANLRAAQRKDGAFPHVAPNLLTDEDFGAAGWGDAGVLLPWTLYQIYGDRRILADNYRSMQLWIQYMGQRAGENLLWQGDFQFGDWLAIDRLDLGTPLGLTESDLIATAYFAHSTRTMSKVATVFGRQADAEAYDSVADQIREAFQQEYVTPNGRLTSNTQTAYVLALAFDLLPEKLRPRAVERLVADIEQRGYHPSTGFLGTPLLCNVLSDNGRSDIAYKLLLNDTFPGWLYPLTQGATTIWERWDGIRPDGSLQNPAMNSLNHVVFGSIGDWLYRKVAGLSFDEANPAYKRALIHPHPGGDLTMASAELETMVGRFKTDWTLDGKLFILNVTIPANASALIVFPSTTISGITEQGRPLTQMQGLRETRNEKGKITAVVGSGTYSFKIAKRFYKQA